MSDDLLVDVVVVGRVLPGGLKEGKVEVVIEMLDSMLYLFVRNTIAVTTLCNLLDKRGF